MGKKRKKKQAYSDSYEEKLDEFNDEQTGGESLRPKKYREEPITPEKYIALVKTNLLSFYDKIQNLTANELRRIELKTNEWYSDCVHYYEEKVVPNASTLEDKVDSIHNAKDNHFLEDEDLLSWKMASETQHFLLAGKRVKELNEIYDVMDFIGNFMYLKLKENVSIEKVLINKDNINVFQHKLELISTEITHLNRENTPIYQILRGWAGKRIKKLNIKKTLNINKGFENQSILYVFNHFSEIASSNVYKNLEKIAINEKNKERKEVLKKCAYLVKSFQSYVVKEKMYSEEIKGEKAFNKLLSIGSKATEIKKHIKQYNGIKDSISLIRKYCMDNIIPEEQYIFRDIVTERRIPCKFKIYQSLTKQQFKLRRNRDAQSASDSFKRAKRAVRAQDRGSYVRRSKR